MTPTLIDQPDALGAALTTVAHAPWLAVDTEFLRERTYYPKLCLLQIGAPTADFFVDTLVLSDLERLSQFLTCEHQVKIFHAARQDLEALNHAGIGAVWPLFDTQLAAAMVGHPDQVAYAWLVQHYFGVTLDKSQTRTDWTQRPLSPAQLAYAQDDVKYLGALYQVLRQALEEAGKLDWLWEETAGLAPAVRGAELPEEAWRRLPGLAAVTTRAAARGRALAIWRERTAQRLDCPRGWLLKDEVLLAIAANAASSRPSLGNIAGMAASIVRRHGDEIIQVLAATEFGEDSDIMHWRLSTEGTRLLGELQALVKQRAAETGMSATLIANRKDLEATILGDPPSRLLQGWRVALLGSELVARVAQCPLEQRRQVAVRR